MSSTNSRVKSLLDSFRDLVIRAERQLQAMPGSRHQDCFIDVTEDIESGDTHVLLFRYFEPEDSAMICLVDATCSPSSCDIRGVDEGVVWVASQTEVPVSWRIRLIPRIAELIELASQLEAAQIDNAEGALAELEHLLSSEE